MPDLVDSVLDDFENALEGISSAVKSAGDAVGTTQGQLAHVTHFSGDLLDGVSRLKLRAFRLAETMESPRFRRACAAGLILFLAVANALRASLPPASAKKKRRR